MHKDQHGEKNGRDSQGRLGSKPKDHNTTDKGYFYHCVLKNGGILRSGRVRSVDKPIAGVASPNIRWRWVVGFKRRNRANGTGWATKRVWALWRRGNSLALAGN